MSETTTPHILLVEDNMGDIYVIQRAIAECSPRSYVWSVTDGAAALAFLRQEPPFVKAPAPVLILLDLNIPKYHGWDVLVEVRRMPAHHTTPVVIFSSSPPERDEQHCLQLGANGYVQKPFDFDTYVGRIQNVMRQWLGAACTPP